MIKYVKSLLPFFCMALINVSCSNALSRGAYLKLHDDTTATNDQVAYITNIKNTISCVRILAFDDKPVQGSALDGAFTLEVSPGVHTITVTYWGQRQPAVINLPLRRAYTMRKISRDEVTVSVFTEAGHTYLIDMNIIEDKADYNATAWYWEPVIYDISDTAS